MKLTSRVFTHNQEIPEKYTGEASDISPPLEWSDVPEHCREFALVCEDPDAPMRAGKDHPFVHWIAYGISPTTTSLPEAIPPFRDMAVPIGYAGPMPPIGHGKHRYIFKLYALKSDPGITPGATKDGFMHAIQNHILAEAELIGTFERKAKTKAEAEARYG